MTETNHVYVLDSFAILAHFQAEAGGEKVLDLLTRATAGEISLAMSMINIGEIIYLASRKLGKTKARRLLDDLRTFPIKFYEVTEERIFTAAWLKADVPMSYADAFAASLARELNATLVTGDVEFQRLKDNPPLLWLE